jgi:hypothetical protein
MDVIYRFVFAFVFVVWSTIFMFAGCTTKPTELFLYQVLDEVHGKNLVIDVNRDGVNDIVTIASGEHGGFYWYQLKDSGVMEKNMVLADTYFRGDRINAVDLDGDGDLDIVTGFRSNDDLSLVWLKNPMPGGNPSDQNSWQMIKIENHGNEKEGETSYPKDIVAADFDGDGKVDVATRTNIKTRIFFQETPEIWSLEMEKIHHHHEGMDVGDLDLDGDPDLILNGFWFETPENPRTDEFIEHRIDEKWYGQEEGSWRDDNASVKVADITGDGKLDVLISHSEKPGYPISLYSALTIDDLKRDSWQEIKIAEVYDFCQTLDAGDIDNDGDLDILAAKFERDHGSERWRNYPPFPVSVFLNLDGKGKRWKERRISERGMYAGIFGDVGSDGSVDIVGPRSYWTGPTDFYKNMLK